MPKEETASKEKQDQKKPAPTEIKDEIIKRMSGQIKDLRSQLGERDTRLSGLEEELKVASADVDEDEKLKNVRTYLVEKQKKLDRAISDYDKKTASLVERERGATIKELVAEFRAKGVEVDAETLVDEENPRLKCLEIYATHLEQGKKEETGVEKTSEVFETGLHGVTKKAIKDMTDEEFAEKEKSLKADYYAKK